MPDYSHVVQSTGNPNDGVADVEVWRPLVEAGPYRLDSGQATLAPTVMTSGALSMASQTLRLGYFDAFRNEGISQARVLCGGTAAGATPTLVRYGLYTVADNGDLTLVASTPNDTTLLATINTGYSKALSTPYRLLVGQRYAGAVLVVTGAAAPTIGGSILGVAVDSLGPPPICGVVSGQADLPASIVAASIAVTSSRPYIAFLP